MQQDGEVSGEVRVVVVGYGFAGRRFHAPLVAATPGLRLHGVVARSADARQAALADYPSTSLVTYESLEEALSDPAVELVVLATPTPHHPRMALAALAAQKHVVTDKPMALSLADCDAMIAAAREHNRFLGVFHNRRWDGDFLTLRRLLSQNDTLGSVRWIELAYQVHAKSSRQWKAAAPEEGGGRYWDLGPHMVDQLLLLFADRQPTSVYARIHFDEASGTDTHALLIVSFDNGAATGVCDFSSATTVLKPRYLVVGERATFVKHGLDPQERALVDSRFVAGDEGLLEPESQFGRLKLAGGRSEGGADDVVVRSEPGRWRAYYDDVRRRLRGGAVAELSVTVEQVRRQIAILEAGLLSARTGAVVPLHAL